jgi:hypothetical protein
VACATAAPPDGSFKGEMPDALSADSRRFELSPPGDPAARRLGPRSPVHVLHDCRLWYHQPAVTNNIDSRWTDRGLHGRGCGGGGGSHSSCHCESSTNCCATCRLLSWDTFSIPSSSIWFRCAPRWNEMIVSNGMSLTHPLTPQMQQCKSSGARRKVGGVRHANGNREKTSMA